MTTPLAPSGIRLVADPSLRRTDGGRVIIGGAPLRIMRLSATGAAVVGAWLGGTPVAAVKSSRGLARRLLDAGIVHPVVAAAPVDDLTVVVPVRGDPDGLGRCLASLGEVPVVVVDDGSEDAVTIADAANRHGAQLVRREVSGGPGIARMEGVAAVHTSLVAFVDADVEAWPGWLDHLVAHFDDEVVVAVAPRVRSRPGAGLRDRYERHHSPLDLGPVRARVGPGRPVAYVPTAAMVIRVAALHAVDGFDPGLRFGEDVDLVWRLVEAGGVVRYEPDVEVIHEPRSTWIGWLGQRRAYGSSAAALGVRHGSKIAPARCSPWSAAAWGAVAAGHPLIGLGVATGSSAALVPKLAGLEHPVREAARLALPGHLRAGLGLARAVGRAWWPVALLAAMVRPRLRPVVALTIGLPPLLDWVNGARPTDPVRSVALRIVDDITYGVGVWEGVIRHRDATALTADFSQWPSGRAAVETDTVPAS